MHVGSELKLQKKSVISFCWIIDFITSRIVEKI